MCSRTGFLGGSAVSRAGIRGAGFTFVELLIVLVIVLILAGIALPAVQGVRESARLVSCKNKVRQIAQAVIHHEHVLGHYPSGGWGPDWLPVANRGSDSAQPGGWMYCILPYLDGVVVQALVFDVNAANSSPAYVALAAVSLDAFSCPSRRTARVVALPGVTQYRTAFTSSLTVPQVALADYAANGGSTATCPPMSLIEAALQVVDSATKVTFCHVPPGNSGNYQTQSLSLSATEQGHSDHEGDHIGPCFTCDDDMATRATNPASLSQGDAWRALQPLARMALPDGGIPDLQDGILHRMSRYAATNVMDGMSNTYLVGEKYVAADRYATGGDAGDDRTVYAGYSSSNVRWAYDPPAPDEPGVSRPNVFGSGHRAGWTVGLADGSVRTARFDVDQQVHRGLAARADGSGSWPEH
jgi:prepilin-type N-terminal cleavage/methylation domain-containing protein